MSPESIGTKPDKTLNVLGLYCPEPIFRLKMEMDTMLPGQIIEVLADDPAAEEDISRWTKRTGQKLLALGKQEGRLHFLLEKVK